MWQYDVNVSFRFVPFRLLHRSLFRSVPSPSVFFWRKNGSSIRKTNTCVGAVLELSDSRTYRKIHTCRSSRNGLAQIRSIRQVTEMYSIISGSGFCTTNVWVNV